MLGLALMAVTVMLYYAESGEGFRYAYVTGAAMVAVLLVSFVRFNLSYLGSDKK